MTAPSRALAEFAAGLRFEDLPAPVVHQACRLVLDAVGCAVSAWVEDPGKARIARDMAALYPTAPGVGPGAGVIGAGGSAQPAFAALANGILINAADNDDTHKTNGTFGGAATAAHAMGLDADGVQRALGLAGTQAAGLNTFFESGDMTKSLHPGKAAMNGVLSAQLAGLGMTSPPGILEHPKGYLAAFSLEPKAAALTDGLGSSWEILQNGFKFFPSILASHSPIQATLAIVAKHRPDPARIARITNETYDTVKSHFSSKEAATVMAARVSVPYCIAAAAVDGVLTQAQFAAGRIHDPLIRRVLERTEVIADPELNKLYPANFPARVTITMDDGQSFTETVMLPKGDPGAPLTEAELEDKFRGNVEPVFGAAQATRLRDAILRLPEGGSVEALSALLVPGAA